MKRKTILFLLLLSGFIYAQDFSLDNKSYSTISWQHFIKKLEKNPNLIFFDIRTKGEQCDTSQYNSYNQGRIKGAIETDYFDFKKNYPEYKKYKNDTIYLYCSHSRRSRLLAKQLADSSFTKVVNINGGMSYLNALTEKQIPLKKKFYQTNLNYELISPIDFIKELNNKNTLIIDVRPDSIYSEKAKVERGNSFGTIKNVLHVPFDKIQENYHLIDTKKDIVLFDNEGEQAPMAANYFFNQRKKVSMLLFGLYNLQNTVSSKERKFLNSKYQVILPTELFEFFKNSNTVIIDTRTPAEFISKDTLAWKNVGKLKNAINIPLASLSKEQFEKFKGKKIILYDIMMHDELYEYAKRLKALGITDFYLLAGGINLVRWEIANTDRKELITLID